MSRAEKLSAFLQNAGFVSAILDRCTDGVYTFYMTNSVDPKDKFYLRFTLTEDEKSILEELRVDGHHQSGKCSCGRSIKTLHRTIHLLDDVKYMELEKIDSSIYNKIPESGKLHDQTWEDSSTVVVTEYHVISSYVLEERTEFWEYIWPDGQTYDESTTHHIPKLYRAHD